MRSALWLMIRLHPPRSSISECVLKVEPTRWLPLPHPRRSCPHSDTLDRFSLAETCRSNRFSLRTGSRTLAAGPVLLRWTGSWRVRLAFCRVGCIWRGCLWQLFIHVSEVTCSSTQVIDYSGQEVTWACRWYITSMCVWPAHAYSCGERGTRLRCWTAAFAIPQSMQWHGVRWLITSI